MSLTFDWNQFDSVVGSARASKILRMLTIYDTLTVKELMDLTGISESQIHVLLRNLLAVQLLTKKSRGVYRISDLQHAQSIRNAYLSILLDFINKSIYEIQELLRNQEKDKAFNRLDELLTQYEPLLQQHFSRVMASLSHEFM